MVDKLTNNIKELDIVNKINEIIDNSGSGGSSRNIGEIVASTVPLTDAGLHLLDGALISGSGSYSAFVDYMADLYTDQPVIDVPFIQPILSANGTLGGNSFAVSASSAQSGYEAWKGFDNDSSTYWSVASGQSSGYYIIYNPAPINVTSVLWENYHASGYQIDALTVYGSNDNSIWTEINSTLSENVNYVQIITLANNDYYKYYKFDIPSGAGYANLVQMAITATYQQTAIFFCSEADWQQSVTDYGVCSKFVYDSVNNTVRLPKYSDKIYTSDFKSTTPVIWTNDAPGSTSVPSGLAGESAYFYRGSQNFLASNKTSSATFGGSTGYGAGLETSLANITTALDGYYYIVIATSTKTDIQVNIDEIATDLNGKADVDLTNTTPSSSFVSNIFTKGCPDWSAGINKTLPFTADTDGWLYVLGSAGGSSATTRSNGITVNGETVYICSVSGSTSIYTGGSIFIPINVDDQVADATSGYSKTLIFYPLKGAS